jgi:outer membrane protein
MMKQRTVWLIVLIWVMATSSAYALGLEVAAGGWYQDPGGYFSYKALSSNDRLDVDNNLNYDSQIRLQGRAKIDMPLFLPNIYLMAAPAAFDGTGVKNTAFNFGGVDFNANVPFYSKLTVNQYDVGLYYGLPFLRTATLHTLNIDIGLDARIVDLKARVRQNSGGTVIDEEKKATVPLPLVYIGVQVTPFDWLSIEAEGRGMSISGDSIYSLIGRIRFNVFGPVFVAGGYRYDKVNVDESDVNADFSIQGPFAEVGLKF